MRPMTASPIPEDVSFPKLVSKKLDGVRALIKEGKVLSRTLTPIPNHIVQQLFGIPELEGLDGELIVGDPYGEDVFNRTMSGVMSQEGQPDVYFYAFDYHNMPGVPFYERNAAVEYVCAGRVVYCAHEEVRTKEALSALHEQAVAQGYEGLMLRDPNGPYKFGKSTVKEQYLLKMKSFQDSEAQIIDTEPLFVNNNPIELSRLGLSKRATCQSNKVATNMVGAIWVQDIYSGVKFKIGSGFSQEDRLDQNEWIGKIVKYKYQCLTPRGKPRHAVFIGFRDPIDIRGDYE